MHALKAVVLSVTRGRDPFYHVQGVLNNLLRFYDILTLNDMWFDASTAQEAHDVL